MRFPHHVRIFRGQLDAAPFMGMLMLLVIFLLLGSSMVFVPGVPIQLPETAPLPGADPPTAVVVVDHSGQFYFDHQMCNDASLKARLKQGAEATRGALTLIVQADKGVRYEVLVRLSVLAREAGLKQVLLATRPQVVPAPASPL